MLRDPVEPASSVATVEISQATAGNQERLLRHVIYVRRRAPERAHPAGYVMEVPLIEALELARFREFEHGGARAPRATGIDGTEPSMPRLREFLLGHEEIGAATVRDFYAQWRPKPARRRCDVSAPQSSRNPAISPNRRPFE